MESLAAAPARWLIAPRLLAPSLATDLSHFSPWKPHLIEVGLFHVFTHALAGAGDARGVIVRFGASRSCAAGWVRWVRGVAWSI